MALSLDRPLLFTIRYFSACGEGRFCIGGYRYTVADNDVVLIDPITGQVAEVIEPD